VSPSFSTSAPQGGEVVDGYHLGNDMWNASKYDVTQTLYACSASSWYVTSIIRNDTDQSVKTYPNVHMDFGATPAISRLHSLTSSFAQATAPSGIYEYAYDIWINGMATAGATEIMIWTYNHDHRVVGSQVATLTVGGLSFQVWKKGSFIVFLADQNVASGSLDLLQFLDYVIGQGWMASDATLHQVDYGVELASTSGVPETFAITNFSVASS
jgi:hypothetical protein